MQTTPNTDVTETEWQTPYLLFARLHGYSTPPAFIADARRRNPRAYPSTEYLLWLRAMQATFRDEGSPLGDFEVWLVRRCRAQIAALTVSAEDWVSTWLPTGGAPLWAPSIYAGAR